MSASRSSLRLATRLRASSRGLCTPPPAPAAESWLSAHKRAPQGGAEMPPHLPARQRRIIHRARQRGWLELDILFGGWAAAHVPHMRAEDHLAAVEDLLRADTPDVLKWVLRHTPPPQHFDTHVLKSLQSYAGEGRAAESR